MEAERNHSHPTTALGKVRIYILPAEVHLFVQRSLKFYIHKHENMKEEGIRKVWTRAKLKVSSMSKHKLALLTDSSPS